MNVPGTVISTLRLAYTIASAQQSASEMRRQLYDSVAGQRISFTPQVGEEIELHLRNCTYDEESLTSHLTVSVSDPNRAADFFRLETDIRYHYLNIYFQRPQELSSPLVREMNFIELGPEDYIVELGVYSSDPPTLQMAFERLERVLTQIHTEYHQFLCDQYETYNDEFEVTESIDESKPIPERDKEYIVESELDEDELIPERDEYDFDLRKMDGEMGFVELMNVSYNAYDYIKYVILAEASDGDCFALTPQR